MGAEKHPDDKIQSEGRKDNAAQHLNAAPDNAGAERYPSINKDDSVDPSAARPEDKSFRGAENPEPRQGAGDGGPSRASDPTLDQSAAKR
jgi:hypothetical protein